VKKEFSGEELGVRAEVLMKGLSLSSTDTVEEHGRKERLGREQHFISPSLTLAKLRRDPIKFYSLSEGKEVNNHG
jgi:hypothetical protein